MGGGRFLLWVSSGLVAGGRRLTPPDKKVWPTLVWLIHAPLAVSFFEIFPSFFRQASRIFNKSAGQTFLSAGTKVFRGNNRVRLAHGPWRCKK